MLLGRLVDRVVVAVAHQDVQQRHEDGDDPSLTPDTPDLLGGSKGVVGGHAHGKPVTRVHGQPLVHEVVVEGPGQHDSLVRVRQRRNLTGLDGGEHGVLYTVPVQVVFLHEHRVRTTNPPTRRFGIPPYGGAPGQRRTQRVVGQPGLGPLEALLPGGAQIGHQPLDVAVYPGMYVRIYYSRLGSCRHCSPPTSEFGPVRQRSRKMLTSLYVLLPGGLSAYPINVRTY